jgi:hypothetical protein
MLGQPFNPVNEMSGKEQGMSDQGASRRDVVRIAGGGLALAGLAIAGLSRGVQAQEATPEAGGPLDGLFVVLRTRVVKADKDPEELTVAVRDGLIPIMKQIPGFVEYYVVQNDETRERTAVNLFETEEGAAESSAKAGEFLKAQGLADHYEDVNPISQQGWIVLSATSR